MNIPSSHQQVMPYLILENAQGFISFMEKIFGAKETHKGMRDENIIMHAEIMIGDNTTIMCCDATQKWDVMNAGCFIYVDDADETFKKALAEGATVMTEMADQPYGRSGGIKDPFGNVWWITSAK
jgi:PhnB protein